jgi:hypothetical protein
VRNTTPRVQARIAGALYVICIVSGCCAEFFVRGRLVVLHDPAATADHILASQSLYRVGFLADFVALAAGTAVSVLFYQLFRVVSRGLALLALVFAVVSNTVSFVALVLSYAPLVFLGGTDYLHAFEPRQLQTLAWWSITFFESGYALNLALFSFDCLITGYLIFKSTFLPRALGVLLALAGLCYLTNSFLYFMPPTVADSVLPYILLPCILAEGSLALWLLVIGVDTSKWVERLQGELTG